MISLLGTFYTHNKFWFYKFASLNIGSSHVSIMYSAVKIIIGSRKSRELILRPEYASCKWIMGGNANNQ